MVGLEVARRGRGVHRTARGRTSHTSTEKFQPGIDSTRENEVLPSQKLGIFSFDFYQPQAESNFGVACWGSSSSSSEDILQFSLDIFNISEIFLQFSIYFGNFITFETF